MDPPNNYEVPPVTVAVPAPTMAVVQQVSDVPGVEFVGSRYTVLNKQLAPGETFVAEAGAMLTMSSNIRMRAFFGGLRGVLSGEDVARVRFVNASHDVGYVGLTPNQPMAIVVAVDLDEYGGSVNAKRGAYVAGPESITPTAEILPANSCLACCCGGMPPVIQSLRGYGVGYVAAGGTVVRKRLRRGEEIVVDTHSVLAFTNSVRYDVRRVGTCLACCFGGEGCFITVLGGPGDVYIQSMPYEKLVDFLVASGSTSGTAEEKNHGREGEGRGGGHHHRH